MLAFITIQDMVPLFQQHPNRRQNDQQNDSSASKFYCIFPMALPYTMFAAALLVSTAGVVRGSRTHLHAHHLAGLLFGCVYAIGAEYASVHAASPYAASRDAAEVE